MMITSTHHQAQFPCGLPNKDYRVLAWTNAISMFHLGGTGEEMNPSKEVEICYYPKINGLAIQGHPEYLWVKKEDYTNTFDYLNHLYSLFMTDRIKEYYN